MILASVRETGDRGRNTGAPGKYGRSGNPTFLWGCALAQPVRLASSLACEWSMCHPERERK